jgi:hypothetical protein|tara:strand:- start:475 stop:669 length:195 start_codon:yes stop_codon:yes gene_type:complete
MSEDVLEYLSGKFRDEIDTQKDAIMMGQASDFADYKYAAGIIRGLFIANLVVKETAERMEQEDE